MKRSVSYDVLNVDLRETVRIRDIYYIAALVEGEGSFRSTGDGLRISMADHDVIVKAAGILGRDVTVNGPYKRSRMVKGKRRKYSPMSYLRISGPAGAGWMMTIYPLMGKRRRGQIKMALLKWKKRRCATRAKFYLRLPVVQWREDGLSNPAIARKLNIACATVRSIK